MFHNKNNQDVGFKLNQNATSSLSKDLFSSFQELKNKANENQKAKEAVQQSNSTNTQQQPIQRKSNRHALSSQQSVNATRSKAQQVSKNELNTLTEDELTIWNIIKSGNILSQTIASCDLPTDEENNAVMVKLVQDLADEILADADKTWLRKIIDIALLAKNHGFGNCQEKAFFGFAVMLYQLAIQNKLASLRLASFYNHFILIVNERFLMDPWLNFAFPLLNTDIKKNIDFVFSNYGKLENYFSIDGYQNCIAYKVTERAKSINDLASTADLTACFELLTAKSHQLALFMEPKIAQLSETSKKRKATEDGNDAASKKPKQENSEEHDNLDDFLDTIERSPIQSNELSRQSFVLFSLPDDSKQTTSIKAVTTINNFSNN